jgi:hypothetical protein
MYVQEPGYFYDRKLKFYSLGKDGINEAECMVPVPDSWVKWVE